MLIGVFVFYIKHLQLYKLRLIPWRSVLAEQPQPGEVTQAEERELMASLWTAECDDLLTNLKWGVLSRSVLDRPDPR